MLASGQTEARKLHARLKHPIIDADGHWAEYAPLMREEFRRIGGDRRLFPVSPVRRRDAGCVSQRRRDPPPPVQPLLLAYSRRKGRQISQGKGGVGGSGWRPSEHRRSKRQKAEISGVRSRRLSGPQRRRRRLS